MWKQLKTHKIFENLFFKLRVDRCELPDGRVMPEYYVMEFSDWVHVVPVTHDQQLVMIDQYRYAAGRSFLEFPGGSTHPGQNENPLLAAQRELLEETGYQAEEWIYLGGHSPNPAIQNNKMHTYLAKNCQHVQSQDLDPYEDLSVVLVPIHQVAERLLNMNEQHSLMLASWALAAPHLSFSD